MKSFKNNIRTGAYIGMAMFLTFMSACQKDEVTGDLKVTTLTAADVKFTATPSAANANVIAFKNETPGVLSVSWDLGNGSTSTNNEVTGSYPIAGTYTVKLKVATAGGGVTESTRTVTIAATNPSMLSAPEFGFISGGLADADGVTWLIDRLEPGHLGVGPLTSGTPDWWAAPPNDKASEGFYDDEMTFNMNGLKYTYMNNGNTFVNGSNSVALGGTGASADVTLPYTPPTNMTWLITEEGGKKILTISNGGFLAYYVGVSRYEILAMDANTAWLKSGEKANAGNGWWYRLIRKGYTRPVVPPVAKPLQAANIGDDFDATANVTWTAENMNYARSLNNFFPWSPNTSLKIGSYEKWTGDGGQYGNLQVTMPYRFDLTTKNKVKMKVYFPSGNDFTKVQSTVAVKLQNSLLGGNSWTTQREVKLTVTPAQYNQWIELEFDFSAWASDTVYDKIVIQLGGEGHPHPGLFYIDDFEFK